MASGSGSGLFASLAPSRLLAATGCGINGSDFEDADANLAVDNAGCMDWNGFDPVTWGGPAAPYQQATKTQGAFNFVGLQDATATNDSTYKSGTKQDDSCPDIIRTGANASTPNKDDLARLYFAGERINNEPFLFLAWVRAPQQTINSDLHIAFEFNQSTTACANGDGMVPRTPGDILIGYEFQSSGVTITEATWSGSSETGTWSDATTLDSSIAEAAANTGGGVTDAIKPPSTDLFPTFDPGTDEFGEAGIDIGAFIPTGEGKSCETFGTVSGASRSSGSSTSSNMEDLVGPGPVDVSNCATPTIGTQTSVDSMNIGDTQTVGDTATLTDGNNPTGDVSFQLYSDADCQTPVAGVNGTAALDNNGVATFAGAPFTPDHAGTYYWGVSYAGDDLNNGATACGGDNEEIIVGPASPLVTTVASPDSVVVGSDASASVSDTATFTDGFQLDGQSALFTLYSDASCSTSTSVSGSAMISGGSAMFTGDASGLGAGTYYWGVSYAGDTNNNPVSECGGDEGVQSEVLTIEPASPLVTTVASPDSVVVGSDASASVSDTATFTDGFQLDGQSALFTLYSDASCSTSTSVSGSAMISGGSAMFTGDASGLGAGTYYWGVSYAGDTNNNPVSECGGDEGVQSEVLTIEPASPLVTTVASPDSVVVGSDASASVSDTATFTDGFQLDGQSALFTLYSDASCSTSTSVSGSAMISGGSAMFTGDASGLGAGTYYWGVSYAGDTNNNPVSECGGDEGVQSEVLTIGLNAPKVTTVADPSSPVVVGSAALASVSDTATFTDGFMLAGDNVDFTLYSDPSCDQADATSVAGSAEIAQDNTATFTGNASALPAGTYYWGVSFLGDTNNNPVSECGGDEGVQNEKLTILPATPSASTTLKDAATNTTVENGTTLPHGSSVYDTAQFGNTGGQPLTGTVSFRFFHNGDCSGDPAKVQTGVAVGGNSDATGALDQGSYGFQAMYVAGDDPNHTDSAWSACEPFKIQGLVDLMVTKSGSPGTQELNPDSRITWTIVVTNNGPDADTGAKITDPMPAGNTFVSVTTSKGTCTGGATLNCTIGDMAVGEHVTITLITTPSAVGGQTNTVNVAGDLPETNTSNNAASATVQVVGTPTPPKPCIAVSRVTPKQLFVGRKTKLTIHLTQGGKAVKGIHVRIKGAKINVRTGASNSKGVVKQTLKMKKAGVLVFTPIASKACNTRRVGVTNVFTPPVTG